MSPNSSKPSNKRKRSLSTELEELRFSKRHQGTGSPRSGQKRKAVVGHCEQLPPKKQFKWSTGSNHVEQQSNHSPSEQTACSPHSEDTFNFLYKVEELLGSGGCGWVHAGVRKSDGMQVAIKFVTKRSSNRFITVPGESHELLQEVALMRLASRKSTCQHVIQLLDWYETAETFIMVLERPSPCMDLFDYCLAHGISEELARYIMMQVLAAVHHCHVSGVLHRDIKPENLLINTSTMVVKLIDFGCGDLFREDPYTEFSGTELYAPPEWFTKKKYKAAPATVWNLGILLYQLLFEKMPFDTVQQIKDRSLMVEEGVSEACWDVIDWCLTRNPGVRPTLNELFRHEWFQLDR